MNAQTNPASNGYQPAQPSGNASLPEPATALPAAANASRALAHADAPAAGNGSNPLLSQAVALAASNGHYPDLPDTAQLIDGQIQLDLSGAARIPTQFGEFTVYAFTDGSSAREHLACVRGDLAGGEPVLTRVHSECLTGDVLGSQRCDCGIQLEMGLEQIGTAGRGVLLYLRNHEGRGIGLGHKLKAYELQDAGQDTVEANLHQGLPIDARDYYLAAAMLRHLEVGSIRLLTNNPAKIDQLSQYGIAVAERVPLETAPSPENLRYLKTKRDKLGHLLSSL